jgi:hypothetical protein
VKTQRPIISDEEHVVLKFRPRTSAHPPGGREEPDPAKTPSAKTPSAKTASAKTVSAKTSGTKTTSTKTPNIKTSSAASPAASDLSRYERPRDEGDDFRHRMLANVAALAFTVALTAIGIWLAVSIADLRKTQDCVLMGRRDCARISVMPQG